jgi:hypothetical protein
MPWVFARLQSMRKHVLLVVAIHCVVSAAAPQTHASTNQIEQLARKKEAKPQISQKEAEELFRHLDEVLNFVSDDTKLAIQHPVKKKLASRDQVEKNLTDRLSKDEDMKRLERSELVLKKFGFIPRDFALRDYVIGLMREQVAGFYNTDDQTVYMMDWVPEEEQMPVMAHELTHALQDQNFGLSKWLKGDPEAAKKQKDDPSKESDADNDLEVTQDEEQTARQAVAEGQGMVVMIDYELKDSGQTAMTAPDIVEAMKAGMHVSSQFPMYHNAPLYLQESLSFPYEYGLDFVREMLYKRGKALAYAGILKDPPVNTREVLEPKTYLADEQLPPMHLPAMKPLLGKNYERYDVGSVGEFDVKVLLEQFAGEKVSEKLYPQWRGGAYYAARIKGDDPEPTDETKQDTKSIALLYLSRWSSPQAAERFRQEYAKALLKRYLYAQSTPPKDANAPVTHWMTNEGPVLVEAQGNSVLALEGFDPETLEQLRAQVFATEATPAQVH